MCNLKQKWIARLVLFLVQIEEDCVWGILSEGDYVTLLNKASPLLSDIAIFFNAQNFYFLLQAT